MRVVVWLEGALELGHDTFGAYEWSLGIALLVGFLLFALLPAQWLAGLFLVALVAAALWYGRQVEFLRLGRLGERPRQGILELRITWMAVGWALLWSLLALGLARSQGWNRLSGWSDLALLALLVLGLSYLGLGARLGLERWVYLGLALAVLAVVIPATPWLRERSFLATSLLAGTMLLVCGYLGRQVYQRLRSDSLGD